MAIVEEQLSDGSKKYTYGQPSEDVLYEEAAQITELLKTFVSGISDLSFEDVDYDMVMLTTLLIRIDKRKDYFRIFHDDTKINEIKEAGLMAYWILKFSPIKIKKQEGNLAKEDLYTKYSGKINIGFAIFILYSTLMEETSRVKNMKFSISKDYNERLKYAFKYWDLSKEAIMLIAETLFEGMYIKV